MLRGLELHQRPLGYEPSELLLLYPATILYNEIMFIAILGFGREGRAVLKFLKKSPKYKHSKITILDKKISPNYLKNLDNFDIIFRSPGVPYNLPEIQSAIKNGVKISSATKLFFQHCAAPIIGITGTKGKSTTATLIYKILKASGLDAYLAGNIGKPALEILPKLSKKSLVVLELSSFQLQNLTQSPQTAIVLDIFPDHLDAHKNWREYFNAKSVIAKHQKRNNQIFYFSNNKTAEKIAKNSRGKKIAVACQDPSPAKNILMAKTVARYFGCPQNIIETTVKNFHGLENRLEFVRTIENISFYNDSAATNPEATAAAIRSFNSRLQSVILIAGGKDKNLSYAPLAKAIKKSDNVKQIILFGENKYKIKQQLASAGKELKICENLKSAIQAANKTAKYLTANYNPPAGGPTTILFSPSSASFDMFKDYKERGAEFIKYVKRLK